MKHYEIYLQFSTFKLMLIHAWIISLEPEVHGFLCLTNTVIIILLIKDRECETYIVNFPGQLLNPDL